ncbi:response regulator [Maribacter litoralis]|uniref:response regulator n=1 Tax=Maribacter litoralis TaxID=2059726 RepID=UPI003F5CCF0D
MSKLLISIIDDDELYKYALRRMLRKLKINELGIIEFSNGVEAIDFYNKRIMEGGELPDVIFLDINMPLMDGFQFMMEYIGLKDRLDKKAEIFMCSSSINSSDVQNAEEIEDITEYITKPFKFEKIHEILMTVK